MPEQPQLVAAIPVLAALDIAETLAFYESKLGFSERFRFDDYAGVARGPIQIHFWLCGDRTIAENTGCRIELRGIDALYAELMASGVIHPNGGLADKPWGFRQFAALDNNGNLITFAQNMRH